MSSESATGSETPRKSRAADESIQVVENRIQFAKKYARIHSQIDALCDLEDNWNGYGAQRIDPAIVEAAQDVLAKLPLHRLPLPHVVPMTRGRIQFEWTVGARSLELEIESPVAVHYLRCDAETGFEDEEIIGIDEDQRIGDLLEWLVEN